jgi:hypothetical protein
MRLYGRSADDTFATYYRANDQFHLELLAAKSGLTLTHLHTIPDPTYLAFNRTLFALMSRFEDALPASRKIHLVGILVKSG